VQIVSTFLCMVVANPTDKWIDHMQIVSTFLCMVVANPTDKWIDHVQIVSPVCRSQTHNARLE